MAAEIPHRDEVYDVALVASPQPDWQDGMDLGEFLSMVRPGAIGQPGEADGFDSRVSLGMEFQGKIGETGDSWEPYALTGHVRF
jgi:hypothetical protein